MTQTATGIEANDAALSPFDHHLITQGRHFDLYRRLGAAPVRAHGRPGVRFSVWAPSARAVSVVGDFNDWDARRHPMQPNDSGVWETFVADIGPGALYKFRIVSAGGEILPLKADPLSRLQEEPPRSASIVAALSDFQWTDAAWMEARTQGDLRRKPMSIYEVHLGSWARTPAGGYLDYRALAARLIPYVRDLGFTHIELMPIAEHPFYGSWGYQPLGLFAPTRRYGEPDDLRHLIDAAHAAGIGVILDWVVSHFPEDGHGLVRFDGTALYEHDDPRQGRQSEWNTLLYNYGRTEVANFLLCNALAWLEDYHIDGLRADAVASILYLDYGKNDGDWIPNAYGGRENIEAADFLRRLNETVYARCPGAFTIAEESTAWPMVSRPTYLGGLGFGFKWNMGWMNDTLRYMRHESVHRKYHHDDLTFGLIYAFHENFILPLSHDEVVYGKGSLLAKMPGDAWQKFANLRCYLAFMFTHPGKKLLFMGAEIAQWREWHHESSLDWNLLEYPEHRGVQALVRDLNRLHRAVPALHERDCEAEGFAWLVCHDHESNVLAYVRRAQDPNDFVVVVCNFSPVVRHGYGISVPRPGAYRELLNSDSAFYTGSNVGNGGTVVADNAHVLTLTLPPLGALILQPL